MNHSHTSDFRGWSKALRDGIIDYGFKPLEKDLLHILCLETFDADRIHSRVNLESWARRMAMRPDKLRLIWNELVQLGVVDYNAAQGTYTLRPDLSVWSRMRALRVPQNMQAGPELPLRLERPLDDSLSSLSRDTATRQQPELEPLPAPVNASGLQLSSRDWKTEFDRLKMAIQRGNVESEFPEFRTADFSATPADKFSVGPAEKSATSENCDFAATSVAAEKSAVPIASLALVQKAKLAKGEKSAAAMRWLEEIDIIGHLKTERSLRQWTRLCDINPAYVLDRLRPHLRHYIAQHSEDGKEIDDPLRYIAFIARQEGRLI